VETTGVWKENTETPENVQDDRGVQQEAVEREFGETPGNTVYK